jgi:hypothetical protein
VKSIETFEVFTEVKLLHSSLMDNKICDLEEVTSILTTEATGSSERYITTYKTKKYHHPENHYLK